MLFLAPIELVSMEEGLCTTAEEVRLRRAQARFHRVELGGVEYQLAQTMPCEVPFNLVNPPV